MSVGVLYDTADFYLFACRPVKAAVTNSNFLTMKTVFVRERSSTVSSLIQIFWTRAPLEHRIEGN
jgi:hypothetical protein